MHLSNEAHIACYVESGKLCYKGMLFRVVNTGATYQG